MTTLSLSPRVPASLPTRPAAGPIVRNDSYPLLTLWIALCAWLTGGGWLLSAVRRLDAAGYAVLLAGFVLFWWTVLRRGEAPLAARLPRWRRNVRRLLSLRRSLPMIFALSAFVILLRGLLVPLSNDDGLSYRIPRVLHWLHAHGWEWIAVEDPRLNTRGTVSEWLFAPWLLFTRTDQSVILPGWISHLFLPGLIFRAWRNLGVSRRVAWIWMWLLPTAFCLSFQAGNVSNDCLAAFFALAVFALVPAGRRYTPTFRALALAVLAAALMSGTKPNLAPLGLVFAVLLVPWGRVFFRRPAAAVAVCLIATLVSFVPNALFNYQHLHDFIGLSREPYLSHSGGPPWEMFLGNTFLVLSQGLILPRLTYLPRWEEFMTWWMHTPFGHMLRRDFEWNPFSYYPHLAIEQMGLGFTVLLGGLLIFLLTRRQGGRWHPADANERRRWLVHGTMWLVMLQFLCMSPACQGGRLLCAYYAPFIAGIFVWRRLPPGRAFQAAKLVASVAMLGSMYCLIACCENPLVPIWADYNWRGLADAARCENTMQVLPAEEKNVGLIRGWWERESWLWQPYGTRTVYQLPVDVSPESLRERNIRYVVISRLALTSSHFPRLAPWLQSHGATYVACLDRPDGWYLVRFDSQKLARNATSP